MMNQDVVMNEEIMEGVAVEDVVETVDSKGGKFLTLLAVGGLAVLVGIGVTKLIKKAAANRGNNENLDKPNATKDQIVTPDDVNSI